MSVKVIAESIAKMMAGANSQAQPDVSMTNNTQLLMDLAMAQSDAASFVVGTPFGYDVEVILVKLGR